MVIAGQDPVTGGLPRPSVGQLARALLRLACARRLRHVPRVAQVVAMARWNGVEPCSYDLDPEAGNWIPVGAEEAVLAQRGRYAHAITPAVARTVGGSRSVQRRAIRGP